MKNVAIFALAILFTINAKAYSVKVGDRVISIPNPYGFARTDDGVAKKAKEDETRTIWFTQFEKEFETPNHEILESKNKCNLMIHEKHSDINFDQEKFKEFKRIIIKTAENKHIENKNKSTKVNEGDDINLMLLEAIDVSSDVLLLSYIAQVKYPIGRNETASILESIATAYVYVNNKALQLNCISLGRNTEWTKTKVIEWANIIIIANKTDGSLKKEIYKGNWEYENEFYKPLGETVHTAKLLSKNAMNIVYPYDGQARMAIEIMGTSQNGVIVLSTNHGEILCNNECHVFVGFDNGNKYGFKFRQFDERSKAISISPSEQRWFFRKLRSSSRIHIEVEYRKNGFLRFEFDPKHLVWNHYDFSD